MRLLFFGSPVMAVPFLEECARSDEHAVAAVVTQPDRPSGRGMKLKPPPVKEVAERLGLRVLQPPKPSAAVPELSALGPDLAVVVAYGRLLKPDLLAVPRLGFVNVHFSLLPKYRGAAPVQWALMRGERESGVTIFWLDQGMDTGPVQRSAAVPVGPDTDARELFGELCDLGLRELRAALADISAGRVRREPQAGEPSSAPKVTAGLARINFDMPAEELHNRVRGLRAGPKAHLMLRSEDRDLRVGLLRTALEAGEPGASPAPPAAGRGASTSPIGTPAGAPGRVLRIDGKKGFLVQCNPGLLWIREVQPEGKKPLSAADFLHGRRLRVGDHLRCGA